MKFINTTKLCELTISSFFCFTSIKTSSYFFYTIILYIKSTQSSFYFSARSNSAFNSTSLGLPTASNTCTYCLNRLDTGCVCQMCKSLHDLRDISTSKQKQKSVTLTKLRSPHGESTSFLGTTSSNAHSIKINNSCSDLTDKKVIP
jgi:hypothetical protein